MRLFAVAAAAAAVLFALTGCEVAREVGSFAERYVFRDETPRQSPAGPGTTAGQAPGPQARSQPPPKPEPQAPSVPPAPDPEAEARARQEAEQAAFEAAYPLHGVVYHYLAQVFARPSDRSRSIGYMRRGAQFRAGAPVHDASCAAGWHPVPGGGYVCKGKGFQIGAEPQSYEDSPIAPVLEQALPYAYARVTRDYVPQYWELPTPEEETVALGAMTALREADERALARAAAAGSAPATVSESAAEEEAQTAPAAVTAPPPPGRAEVVGAAPEGTHVEDGVVLPEFLRMRMLKGFYVSLDRLEEETERSFYRTVRAGYVRADALADATPPSMRGVVLGREWALPVAFVFRAGTRSLRAGQFDGALIDDGAVERFTPLLVVGDALVRRGRRYLQSHDGVVVRDTAVRIAMAREALPRGVPEGAQWIHVRLAQQTLVAYEGMRPVFATIVSTGKADHETPRGLYQIQSKHVSATMDDEDSPDGPYSIEDVPWTMYFNGSYALHGAFWHSAFGRTHSHGCVNLAPADAHWLFQWTTPALPVAWHGLFADRASDRTWVLIE